MNAAIAISLWLGICANPIYFPASEARLKLDKKPRCGICIRYTTEILPSSGRLAEAGPKVPQYALGWGLATR